MTDEDGTRTKVAVKRFHAAALKDDLNLKLLVSEIDIMITAEHKCVGALTLPACGSLKIQRRPHQSPAAHVMWAHGQKPHAHGYVTH